MNIITPYTRGAGYTMNDDRPSGGTVSEADIRTCPHCQRVIKMQEWRKVENGSMNGGFCTRCMAPICYLCNRRAQYYGCEPFLARLERALDMKHKFKAILKDAEPEPAARRPLFTGLLQTE